MSDNEIKALEKLLKSGTWRPSIINWLRKQLRK